jgi:drug/metabolite transporter (DMT)-like permease
MTRKTINQTILLALLSTLFLSTGLIVNSLNAYHGSSWAWTASLRYLLLLPVLVVIVLLRGKLNDLFKVFKQIPQVFLAWGCIGFGGYYALLSFAITSAPGWLVTAGFMTTIVAGVLLSPLIDPDKRSSISKKGIILSLFLVFSLFLMQLDRFAHLEDMHQFILSLVLSFVAAFLWPLGNRKLVYHLEVHQIKLDPIQRVLGMTIGSLPVQVVLAVYGYITSGAPSTLQLQSSLVAVVFSGVLGSILFYRAMQLAGKHTMLLLTVEATQVTGVLFTLLAEMVFKGTKWPGIFASMGFVIMFTALGIYIWLSHQSTHSNKSKPGQLPSFHDLPAGVYQYGGQEVD